MQARFSDSVVEALERFGELKDRTFEQMFLGIYSSPLLQAMLGMRASDEPPRRRPGIEPERLAFIHKRIAEIKARVAEGGALEAGIRGVLYIGMAGPGADERAFNVLRQIRGTHGSLDLAQFKQMLREQYFALLLDREAALAAIPTMLPADAAARAKILETVRRIVSAAGDLGEERAQRIARVEKLFGTASVANRRSRRVAAPGPARRVRKAPREQRR
jgi:hypothetical protein